ncbi:methyltransferase domain-containing protein [Paraburkholderia silviterrae]|uniref:Methyltransferase domain-containing protein n=1 Tax=Paraburkholderia silviterrae TaxID=2528715 RepID=A0A4R5LYI1_9BURK|nr:methyltransferase domain-containing protein [Paraburkholderia silviterrae]TDG17357.1 methyltransferase domain-containing protein [Paraburkholderia silviterrae]
MASANERELSVAIYLCGGLGDVIVSGRFVQQLFIAAGYPRIDVYYHTPDVARFVFNAARFVKGVYADSALRDARHAYHAVIFVAQFVRYEILKRDEVERLSPALLNIADEADKRLAQYRGLFDRHPLLDGLWGRLSAQAGRNVVANLGFLGNLPIDASTATFLAPDPNRIALADKLLAGAGTPYVTLHDGFDNLQGPAPGQATKCWPLEHWARLVDCLRASVPDLRLVQVGGNKSRHIPGTDVDLVQRTDLHEVAWVIKHALLHIDTDSGLVHMASALHTQSVALFGPTLGSYFGYPGNINLSAGSCGGCWWSTPEWLAQCPRGLAQPACMAAVAPEYVERCALPALTARRAERPRHTLVDARLYDSALHTQRAAVLDQLFTQLDIAPVPITAHARREDVGLYIHASKQWEYLYVERRIEERFGANRCNLAIADIGGGRGALTPYLAARGHRVHLYDIDYLWDAGGDERVERRFLAWAARERIGAQFASLYNLPAEDASFDVVLSVSVVEHIVYKQYALKEALRVLKPGGLLILTFDYAAGPDRFEDGMRREIFDAKRLNDALAALGLSGAGFGEAALERSLRDIRRDGVLGIPDGMTVGGIAIVKEAV